MIERRAPERVQADGAEGVAIHVVAALDVVEPGEALRPRLLVEVAIRIVVIGVGIFLVWFGYENFLRGFASFRMPSMTPIASLYAAIPISGALIALFAFEQLVNGWRNGFESALEDDADASRHARETPP